jgi:hypothetical protein
MEYLFREEEKLEHKGGASRYSKGASLIASLKKAAKHYNIYAIAAKFSREEIQRLFDGKSPCYENLIPSRVTVHDMDKFCDHLCLTKQLKNKKKGFKFNTAERYFSSIKTDLSDRYMKTNNVRDKVDWNESNFKKIRAGMCQLFYNSI